MASFLGNNLVVFIIAGIIIYFMGGFRFITQNPMMVIFILIGFIVMKSLGGK